MVDSVANAISMHDSSSAFCSANQLHSGFDITAETEFCFWDSIESITDDHASNFFQGSQVETRGTEARGGQARIAGSLQVWPLMETSKDHDSTVQPYSRNHHMSPNARNQAIADGRKRLMQAVEDWSEWNLELSLNDIVVVEEEKGKEDMHGDVAKEHRSSGLVREAEFRKQQKSKMSQMYGTGKIPRLKSMDSENFLIKMFFPSSRFAKKINRREESGTKFCLIPKFKDSTELVGTTSWSRRELLSGENQSSGSTSMSTTGRFNEDTQSLGCWPLSLSIKGSSRRRRRSFIL